VIIHGLDEPVADTPEERIQSDNDSVEELLHKLHSDDVSVNKIIRLGRRPEEAEAKPRPVKLILASEDHKEQVLKQAKNLKYLKEGGWHKVFIHQDLTPRQREARKKAVQEMKERQSKGETNLAVINGKVVVKAPNHHRNVLRIELN